MCEKGMQKVMEHVVRTRGSCGEDVNRESHRRSHNIYAKVTGLVELLHSVHLVTLFCKKSCSFSWSAHQCLTAYSCDNHGAHLLDLGKSFRPSHSGNRSEWKWKYMKRAEKFQVLAGLLARLCGNFRRSQKMSWQYDRTVNEVQETSWLVVLLVLALLKAPTSPVQLVQGLIKCVQKHIYFANQDIHPTAVMRSENCCIIFALKWLFNSMLDLQREKSYKSFIQIALTKIESSWDSYTFISSPILS